jgi:DNA-binding CsgD family transcriptional regulator
MLRERDRARVRERLAAVAGAGLGPDEARREAIAALRRVVGFGRWCWPLSDPTSGLSTGGIAEFDLWPSVPRLAALSQHGDVTSKPMLVAGRRASIALSAETGGDLGRSVRWRECLEPYGVGDELMTLCRDRHGCWGSVELMRDSDDRPFRDDETRLLDEVAPLLGTLIRRNLVGTMRVTDARRRLPPATLILDAELRPASWTPAFRAWLAELGVGDMLPPAVYELGARVLAPPTGLDASVRMHTGTGRWAAIEGARLEGGGAGAVAITVRDASPEEVFDVLARTYDLSPRERELAALVLDGYATKQLAAALSISPHTVQDHLKAIFAKTRVRSRRELASHLSGRAG